jgi:MFS family permease
VTSLRSRTFIGLLIAQFFAAFNDQAIHASGMFYAINQQTLDADAAISLMPILFYVPWVLFGTIAGYLADRFSKQRSLIFWKYAEIGITLIALAGFWLGSEANNPWGPRIVLGTVFLMGLHSTFFVPAKYGIMPEILPERLLSKGNGLLESLSFLAVILGTVSGGVLSTLVKGHEYIIGLILVGFAVVGAIASHLIQYVPAANPTRKFPMTIYGPLVGNLRTMIRSKPLGLAVLGIAFFTFVVVFMRASIYMHGESQIERWSEQHTSIIVGMTALGIGLGSPLAGFLSGSKVEVGLIPIGAVGMVLATIAASMVLGNEVALAGSIVVIGFFTGFYIVPMFTLLQYRAPKTSKGDLVATNNFISVTGAIAATVLFFGLDKAAEKVGLVEAIPKTLVTSGTLRDPVFVEGRPESFVIETPEGERLKFPPPATDRKRTDLHFGKRPVPWLFGLEFPSLRAGDQVDVSSYLLGDVTYYRVRWHSAQPLHPAFNKSRVPRYLFLGAAAMTLVTLLLLRLQLPDLLLRTVIWIRALRLWRLKAEGVTCVPSSGAALLVTNCRRVESCLQVLSATDRWTRFVFVENPTEVRLPLPLRSLLWQSRLEVWRPGSADAKERQRIHDRILRALRKGQVVAVPVEGNGLEVDQLLLQVAKELRSPVVPVYTDADELNAQLNRRSWHRRSIHVVFGSAIPGESSLEVIADKIRQLAAPEGQSDTVEALS